VWQSIRPHVWYFVVADCDAGVFSSNLSYSLELFNADGSHFSHEDRGPAMMYPILTVAFLAALVPLATLLHGHVERLRGESLHPAIRHLMLAMVLFLASLVLDTLNARAYAANGRGRRAWDVGAELANWLAQLVVALELLGIAWAWSVDTLSSPTRRRHASRVLLMWMVGALVVLHVLFVLLGRQYDDAHTKYHKSETVWALGLVGMRLVLGAAFAIGIYNLLVRQNNPYRQGFIYRLALLGGAYFVSVPLVVAVASTLFAKYLRHQVVTVGSILVQAVALTALSVLFLTRNEFTDVTTLYTSSLPLSTRYNAKRS
jgi:hypothetical protein